MRKALSRADSFRALFIATMLWALALSACTDNAQGQSSAADMQPELLGFDHVGLVVRDLEASKTFFTDVLGFRLVGSDADYPAHFLDNGEAFVTLWRAADPTTALPFDRKKNIGLHHMALSAASEQALNSLYESAKEFPGVVIEFAPELFYGGPSMHMMIYEPSGNRIEVIYRVQQ